MSPTEFSPISKSKAFLTFPARYTIKMKEINEYTRMLSVQFSCSVMSDSLWPCELQHSRLSCPSPTLGACSNSCPLSWWCHPTISSCVIPFSFCLQSFPASGSFPMSQFFASGSQSIGASASVSVLAVNTQGWLPLGVNWFDLLAVQVIVIL